MPQHSIRHYPVQYWADTGKEALGCLAAPLIVVFQAVAAVLLFVARPPLHRIFDSGICCCRSLGGDRQLLAACSAGSWFGLARSPSLRSIRSWMRRESQIKRSLLLRENVPRSFRRFPWSPLLRMLQGQIGEAVPRYSVLSSRNLALLRWGRLMRDERVAEEVVFPLREWVKRTGARRETDSWMLSIVARLEAALRLTWRPGNSGSFSGLGALDIANDHFVLDKLSELDEDTQEPSYRSSKPLTEFLKS